MRVVSLEGIHRSYQKGVEVLKGVDLAVERGEIVSLVGKNGAGKTTLLRIAMGLLHAQRGVVRIFEMDPWERPVEVKRRIGYVSEEQALPPFLPVSEVLALHRELFPTWDEALAGEFLERFDLDPGARIATLSKGQARQVAFLCAIAHHPELLILDEPAGGLDPSARRGFLEAAISRLNRDGVTILFSSHHMTDVERLAGRVVFIHEGRKLLDRDLDTLREAFWLAVLPKDTPPDEVRRLPGCVALRPRPEALHAVFEGERRGVAELLARHFDGGPACETLSLEDLFIELVEARS